MSKAVRLRVVLSCVMVLWSAVAARASCYMAIKDGKVLEREGECNQRHSPCSTFKIPLSLMGYEEGYLIDETSPVFPFKEGYDDWLEQWKQPHSPQLWMKNSAIWYSKLMTQRLGMTILQSYVTKFQYGNQDLGGDKGKNNGLTNAWLSSSLEISPIEQLVFLEKFVNEQLPVSENSMNMTRNILYLEDLPEGWKLYGKTGMGYKLTQDRMHKTDYQIGWFLGWIEKGEEKIIFVNFIQDKTKSAATFASLRAKTQAKHKVLSYIYQTKP